VCHFLACCAITRIMLRGISHTPGGNEGIGVWPELLQEIGRRRKALGSISISWRRVRREILSHRMQKLRTVIALGCARADD
jgi:hypothetical protein